MTTDEFIDAIHHGAVVDCPDADARAETLKFLYSIGFDLSDNSKRCIENKTFYKTYLRPGLQFIEGTITCYNINYKTDVIIPFADIPLNYEEENEYTDEEFESEFALLISNSN